MNINIMAQRIQECKLLYCGFFTAQLLFTPCQVVGVALRRSGASRIPLAEWIIVGINDSFGRSAEDYDILLEKYGLTPAEIAARARKLLK